MKKYAYVLGSLLVGLSIIITGGCKKSASNNANLALALLAASGSQPVSYAGSSPIGDFIEVTINRSAKTVIHINHTTNVTLGPLAYTEQPAASAWGFSIVRRIDAGGGKYVLFAEFPGAAVVYQIFKADGSSDGWPVYVVARSSEDKSVYYDKAYNWMKFFIDQAATNLAGENSDMNCGFAAWDSASASGLLYGAGYSNNLENESGAASSVNTINAGNTVSVSGFTWDASRSAYLAYPAGNSGNINYALALSGTSSGTVILDFGPNLGGGGGLAIPQAAAKDFQPAYAGTYFTAAYEFDKSKVTTDNSTFIESAKKVIPLKVVITAEPRINVYSIDANTSTGTPLFTSTLVSIEDYPGGPGGVVKTLFQTKSGNASAVSSVVQNAHNCHGAFIAEAGSNVAMIMFDPSGRFAAFTMFDNKGSSANAADDTLRFGFSINDAGYVNL